VDTEKETQIQQVRDALASPAEAIYVYTMHDDSHCFHYIDACVALKRSIRIDEFSVAALASVTMQAAKVSEFNIDRAMHISGAVAIKRRIFHEDAYAFTGGYFCCRQTDSAPLRHSESAPP